MATQVQTNEPFFLFSDLGHDLVLAVEGSSSNPCAKLVLEVFTGAQHQQFSYENGWIVCNSTLVFDIEGGLALDRDVIQYPRHDGANQKFNINSDRTISIRDHGDLVVGARGWSGEEGSAVPAGSKVFLEARNGKANQSWTVKLVHGAIPAGSLWNYAPWGKCVAEWHDNELCVREVNYPPGGVCSFVTKNGDGYKLTHKLNVSVNILWDNTAFLEAKMTDENTIGVNHGGTWYHFERIQPPNHAKETREIQKLWEAFQVFDKDGSGSISAEELEAVLLSLGQQPTKEEIDRLIRECDTDGSGSIDFEEFKNMMVAERGDQESRLRLAFSIFDPDNSGSITANEMEEVMSRAGLSRKELEEMISELDNDGSGSIDFEEFCKLMPREEDLNLYPPTAQFSPLTYVPISKKTRTTTTTSTTTTSATTASTTSTTTTASEVPKEVRELQEMLSRHPSEASENAAKKGTSLLQYQIGYFRLIQGAAYRCFRESFSANHSTHARVKSLPYRISDFVKFVNVAVAMYKATGVVDDEDVAFPALDSLLESLNAEYKRLEHRIANWETIPKSEEMQAQHKSMLAKRNKSTSNRQKFSAGIDLAISLKRTKLSLASVTDGLLAYNELNALREKELANETSSAPPKPADAQPRDYLEQWNRVIIDDSDEKIDGAMMPVSFWYEEFMPKLLNAFSVGGKEKTLTSSTFPDEAALDAWYQENKSRGVFGNFAKDVELKFPGLTPPQKLSVAQAWRFTKHYLNGVQKRRERVEAGREDGMLSHYVAFIDVYLGQNSVKNAEMRISFPYYIGPAVWRLFHSTAEISCAGDKLNLEGETDAEKTTKFLAIFKEFFKLFATMYPCPYCRHHLNSCVVLTKEVEMYPMEYLLLGKKEEQDDFNISLDAKLDTIVDGPALRLFFWKLHNTVSSSIARTEEWYHSDKKAFYTTRYWPSLDSELARAEALGHVSVSLDRIAKVYGLLKPAAHLGGLRSELQRHLDQKDIEMLRKVCVAAKKEIEEDLEGAVVAGKFLQDAYGFNEDLLDASDPSFSPEEEKFARSGVFVEVV